MNDTTTSRKFSRLATISRTCGIIGLYCGILFGITCFGGAICKSTGIAIFGFIGWGGAILLDLAAVICGHLARWKIRKSEGRPEERARALTGLTYGYLSFLIQLTLLFILPGVNGPVPRTPLQQEESNGRVLANSILQFALDSNAAGHGMRYPADAGVTNAGDFYKLLVQGGELSAKDMEHLHLKDFLIGNTGTNDPPKTILLRTTPEASKCGVVIVRLNGSVESFKNPGLVPHDDPPRNPPYLSP